MSDFSLHNLIRISTTYNNNNNVCNILYLEIVKFEFNAHMHIQAIQQQTENANEIKKTLKN